MEVVAAMITADTIRELIVAHDASRPRSRQRAVGPSDLSQGCPRRLGYQLLDVEPVKPRTVNLAAWVGTAIHAQMEQATASLDDWATEIRLSADLGDGLRLSGSADAYHVPTATIIDYKTVGPSALAKYRLATPDNYRAQVAIYGLLAVLSGVQVRHTGIAYLPRNGTLADIHVDVWEWDQDLADRIVADYINLHRAVAAGPAVLPLLPTGDACRFCPWHLPGHIGDLAEACGGHSKTTGIADGNPTPT